MKKLTLLSVMAVLCFFFKVNGQINSNAHKIEPLGGLKPGDTLGVFSINQVYQLNSKQFNTISTENTKGKSIILDFWATWCGSCIGGFKHLQELQSAFNSELLIFLVNTSSRDTNAKAIAFMQKYYEENPEFKISFALKDKKLNLLFPTHALPHYVWIGADGVVKAITGMEELTATNVKKLLSNRPLALNVKVL